MTGELDLRGRRAGPARPEGLAGVAREPGLYGQRAGPVWPEGLGLCRAGELGLRGKVAGKLGLRGWRAVSA